MALYDSTLPPTAYFRPPVYRGGNLLIDKYGKSTLFGDITATALPILGTVGGALTGIPGAAAAGNELGKLGVQALGMGAASGRNDDSTENARNAAAGMMGLATVGGAVANLATPFLGGLGSKATAKTPKLPGAILPPDPSSEVAGDFKVNTPTFPSLLPGIPGEKSQTGLLGQLPLWGRPDAQQTLFGGKKPTNSLFFPS